MRQCGRGTSLEWRACSFFQTPALGDGRLYPCQVAILAPDRQPRHPLPQVRYRLRREMSWV